MAGLEHKTRKLTSILVKVVQEETGVTLTPDTNGPSPITKLSSILVARPGMPWSKLRDLYKEFGLEW